MAERGGVRGGGDRGEKSTYAPINGMVSGKHLWKNARTCSPSVIFSNSSKGMKSVQVNVLSWCRKKHRSRFNCRNEEASSQGTTLCHFCCHGIHGVCVCGGGGALNQNKMW